MKKSKEALYEKFHSDVIKLVKKLEKDLEDNVIFIANVIDHDCDGGSTHHASNVNSAQISTSVVRMERTLQIMREQV